jgi:streptogramin lyase
MALGDVLRSFASPSTGARGLAFDGRTLWHADAITDLIYQLDPRDGTILRSVLSPATNPQDLAFDGRALWLCDFSAQRIYQLSLT